MYTPSAYTLTNTTRPHESNAKNPRGQLSDGWRAVKLVFSPTSKQITIAQRQNHRQQNTKDEDKKNRDPRLAPYRRRNQFGRFAISVKYTFQYQSCPGSRACNPARSHTLHTRAERVYTRTAYTLAPPKRMHMHTYTLNTSYTTVHFITHSITHATDM